MASGATTTRRSRSREQARRTWLEELNFPVELKPLTVSVEGEEAEVPRRRAIVRTDTKEVLNVVSDRYQLIPHLAVFEPVDEAVTATKIGVREVNAAVGMSGAYARVSWILDEEAEIRPKDSVSLMVTARNSYNYESIFELEFGAYRLVCSNGLRSPLAEHRVGGRHMKNLSVEAALERLQGFLESADAMRSAFAQWNEREVAPERLAKFLEKEQAIVPKKAAAAILEYYEGEGRGEGTLWDAYNALTWFATHKVSSRTDRAVITQDILQGLALQFAAKASRN